MRDEGPAISVSVVVPVFDEAENARRLVGEVVEALRPTGLRFELLVVDDGSRDGTAAILRGLAREVPELGVVVLRRNFGQTLALQAGLDRARGAAVVTMDGDLQNDPRDIPALLEALRAGADVVSGWRRRRRDALVLRKLPSWLANRMIRLVTGVRVHDQGCGLKAYRRAVVGELDLYGDMHRFVAVLALAAGATLAEVEVHHRPRVAGASKYGISRTLKVIADLLTVEMLTWFRDRPLRWFALLGTPFLALALLAAPAAVWVEGGGPVLTAVALIAAMTFGSCLLVGLLGEEVLEAKGGRVPGRAVFHEESEAP